MPYGSSRCIVIDQSQRASRQVPSSDLSKLAPVLPPIPNSLNHLHLVPDLSHQHQLTLNQPQKTYHLLEPPPMPLALLPIPHNMRFLVIFTIPHIIPNPSPTQYTHQLPISLLKTSSSFYRD